MLALRRTSHLAPALVALALASAPSVRAQPAPAPPHPDGGADAGVALVVVEAHGRLGAAEAARLEAALARAGAHRARASASAAAALAGGAGPDVVLAAALGAAPGIAGIPAEVRAAFGPRVAELLAAPTPEVRAAWLVGELHASPGLDAASRRALHARTLTETLPAIRAGGEGLALAAERTLDRAAVTSGEAELLVERKAEDLLRRARARLGPDAAGRLAEVIAFAREAHRGQARDGGEPAILHALRVANAVLHARGVAGGGAHAAAVEAAILHDVLEDTRTTREALRGRFGPRTAELVHALSIDPLEAFGGDKAARDRAYYERFARSPEGARVVKLYDRLDNIHDMRGWAPEGQLGYLKRTRETVIEALRVQSPALAARLEAEVTRLEARVRARMGEAPPPDALARFRRADGTVRWSEALRARALRETGGVAHFALALFLKELAVVVRTGDRLRIEEFFDAVATTDFFVHYGLFVAGARAGELAFGRYLERFVRPRFVAGVLKTNVVLATGLALPDLVRGEFSGESFAISLGALGLSSTAVRAGVAGLSWVRDLRAARAGAGLSASGAAGGLARAGRLAGLAGWVYTVAETAVVLYLADELEGRVRAHLDEREARAALGRAGTALLAVTGRPGASADEVEVALEAYREAWSAWREHLAAPALLEDARLHERLERFAREAKLMADERAAALARVDAQPALRRSIEARFGSVEAWADARAREDEARLERDVEAALAAHARARDAVLAGLYDEGSRRGRPLLADEADLGWLSSGAAPGARGDPWGARDDLFARWGRSRARSSFEDALGRASRNRTETWDDERAVLELAGRGLTDPDARAVVSRELALLERARALDSRLAPGAVPATRGVVGALDDAR